MENTINLQRILQAVSRNMSLTRGCLVILLAILQLHLGAQEENPLFDNYISLDYEERKSYEIGGVNVTGTETRDKNAIRSIAKLREGESIVLAGDQIGRGIKSLWALGLFSNVEILLDSLAGEMVFLTIKLIESPTIAKIELIGVKKPWTDDLNTEIGGAIRIGGILSPNGREEAIKRIKDFYATKGHLRAEVQLLEKDNPSRPNSVIAEFTVDPKKRMKIERIEFEGNSHVSDKKLRKLLKETKSKKAFLKKSKYVKEDFKEDKKNIIAHYNKLGYRDAKILGDSVWIHESGNLALNVFLTEGNQYLYRNITWKGNALYTDEQLESVLGIIKGDVYNSELLDKRLQFSLDGRDVSSLYMDNGYLFFQVTPTELSVESDSIDLEMRIYEGPQATIDKVTITGNDRTNENVIRRTIRTVPGEKFSRSDIIRSQRELLNLGYFNPENLGIDTPVNPDRGTVNIEYTVEETPSDQLELSAGFGGFSGLIGTLGVTFNNFSINNITRKEAWSPLPTGDGQRLSVRIQSNGRFFRSYNASFTDPWLGGKKPNSFTVGFAGSSFDNTSFGGGFLNIFRGFVGLGSALKFPDDFFVSNTILNLENIKLEDFANRFLVETGDFRNFNINQTISRSSINQPLYPRKGSKIALSVQFTPPYSLFRPDNFWIYDAEERQDLIAEENLRRGRRFQLTETEADFYITDLEEARKFRWLEYHKWRFDAEWYFNIVGKLVMMTSAKMAYLGSYNSSIGTVPFERFELGGDGLSNQNTGITGTDIVALRGYDVEDLEINQLSRGGASIFNKFTVELRYPLSLNPTSTIFVTTYFQAGNAWDNFKDYSPFDLYRSVGVGLRVFLPMFGLLGFDYAFGLDKIIPGNTNPGLGELSKFSIVLGFEPD